MQISLQAVHEASVGAWMDATFCPAPNSTSEAEKIRIWDAVRRFEHDAVELYQSTPNACLRVDCDPLLSTLLPDVRPIEFWCCAFEEACCDGKLIAAANLFRRVAMEKSAKAQQFLVQSALRRACHCNDERVVAWLLRLLDTRAVKLDGYWFFTRVLPNCSPAILTLLQTAWAIDASALNNDKHWPRGLAAVVRNACYNSHWSQSQQELTRAYEPIKWLERAAQRRLDVNDVVLCVSTACSCFCQPVACRLYQQIVRNSLSLDAVRAKLLERTKTIWHDAISNSAGAVSDAHGCRLTWQWLYSVLPFALWPDSTKINDCTFLFLRWLQEQQKITWHDARGLKSTADIFYRAVNNISHFQKLCDVFEFSAADIQTFPLPKTLFIDRFNDFRLERDICNWLRHRFPGI